MESKKDKPTETMDMSEKAVGLPGDDMEEWFKLHIKVGIPLPPPVEGGGGVE